MRRFALVVPILLAGCQNAPANQTGPVDAQAEAEAPVRDVDAVPVDETAAAALGANDGAHALPSEPAALPTNIPEQFRGRWGMVPADCTSTAGDAKGLLRIDDSRLYFYESKATLDRIVAASADRFEGVFGFGGEGQEWIAPVTLIRQGDTLIRQEEGSRFTYKKCS
jgi:hypothetical protein